MILINILNTILKQVLMTISSLKLRSSLDLIWKLRNTWLQPASCSWIKISSFCTLRSIFAHTLHHKSLIVWTRLDNHHIIFSSRKGWQFIGTTVNMLLVLNGIRLFNKCPLSCRLIDLRFIKLLIDFLNLVIIFIVILIVIWVILLHFLLLSILVMEIILVLLAHIDRDYILLFGRHLN